MSNQLVNCLNFGCVNYINALPLSLYLQEQSNVRVILSSPDHLLQMLLKKEVDIALTSTVGAWHLPLTCHPLFGISARHRVLSVNLYAKPTFFTQPSCVAVPQESTSSVALLKTLSHYVWKQNHHFISYPMHTIPQLPHTHYDALLLIGDIALRHLELPYFACYDLAHEWYKWTQLPFVFATLLTTQSNQKSYEHLFSSLKTAITHFENEGRIDVLKYAHQRTNLSYALLNEYYSLLHYRLTEEDQESLYLFKHYYSHVQ